MLNGSSFVCYVGPRIKRNGGVYSHDSLPKGVEFKVFRSRTSQQGVAEQRAQWLSLGNDRRLVDVGFGLSLFVFEP